MDDVTRDARIEALTVEVASLRRHVDELERTKAPRVRTGYEYMKPPAPFDPEKFGWAMLWAAVFMAAILGLFAAFPELLQ